MSSFQVDIDIKAARGVKDLIAAFHIVYQQYRTLDYIEQEALPVHYNQYTLFPNTHTALARVNNQVCGTGSIVEHSQFGLPSLNIFKDEFEALLSQGRKIAEGTLFANDPETNNAELALSLACYGISYAINKKLDDFCVVVNPAHRKFWETYMGFECISEEKPCKQVRAAHGLLMRLDLNKPLNKRISSRVAAFENSFSYLGADRKLSKKDIVNLVRLKPTIWQTLDHELVSKLENMYPALKNLVSEALALGSFNFANAANQ